MFSSSLRMLHFASRLAFLRVYLILYLAFSSAWRGSPAFCVCVYGTIVNLSAESRCEHLRQDLVWKSCNNTCLVWS